MNDLIDSVFFVFFFCFWRMLGASLPPVGGILPAVRLAAGCLLVGRVASVAEEVARDETQEFDPVG